MACPQTPVPHNLLTALGGFIAALLSFLSPGPQHPWVAGMVAVYLCARGCQIQARLVWNPMKEDSVTRDWLAWNWIWHQAGFGAGFCCVAMLLMLDRGVRLCLWEKLALFVQLLSQKVPSPDPCRSLFHLTEEDLAQTSPGPPLCLRWTVPLRAWELGWARRTDSWALGARGLPRSTEMLILELHLDFASLSGRLAKLS